MVMSSRDRVRYSEISSSSRPIYTRRGSSSYLYDRVSGSGARERVRASTRLDSTHGISGRIADADCHADAAQGPADSSARRRSFPLLCSHPVEAIGVPPLHPSFMPPDRTHTPLRLNAPERLDSASPRSTRSPTSITSPTTPVPVRDDESISCQRCRHRKKRVSRVIIPGKAAHTSVQPGQALMRWVHQEQSAVCVRSPHHGSITPTVCRSSLPRHAVYLRPRYVPNLVAETKRLKERCRELEEQLSQYRQSGAQSTSRPPPVDIPRAPIEAAAAGTTGLIERVIIRFLTKEQDPGSTLKGTIERQLGAVALEEQANTSSADLQSPLWPPLSLARTLVDYFFDLSFGTMRFVHRQVIESE